jgi:hypothetical protein
MNKTSLIRLLTISLITLTLAPLGARAEQAMSFGKYVVHYNAVQTTFLTPGIAQQYHIERSHNRAMLNITIQERTGSGFKAVPGTVTATASNLTGQLKNISMRQVSDGGAIYYIGVFPVDNEEVLDFSVDVQPQNSSSHHVLHFREQFFTR